MAVQELMKAALVVPRSDLSKVVTELSNFDTFHVSEEKGSPSDPHLDELALRSYRLFIDLDEILKELNVKGEVGLIETLTEGHRIEKEKFRAKDWADFTSRLEAEAKPIIEEFRNITSERSGLQKQIEENQALKEAFAMLARLSIDLDTMRGLRRFCLVFSVVSTKDLKEVERSLPGDVLVSTPLTPSKSAILIATPRVEAERVEKALRSFEIRPFEIPERLPQNPADALKAVSRDLKQQTGRMQELNGMLDTALEKSRRKMLSLREGAKTVYDVLTGVKKVGELKRFAVVKGFIPKTRLAEFEERFGRAILFTEEVENRERHEGEEKASSAPTFMRNPPFIRAFENITLNQGPPKYGEVDPTPLITLTFPIFYGIMFGDFGHGAVLILFGLLLYIRGYGSLKQWGVMLTVAGLSAMAVGLMIGEAFGFAIGEIIPGLEHPLLEIVERVHGVSSFNTEAVTAILQISILIGVAHLTIGFGLDVSKAFREKEYVEAYTEKIPTFFMYMFGILFALAFIGSGNSFAGLLTKQDPIPLLGLPVAQATMVSLPIILLSIVVLIMGKPLAILLKKAPRDSVAMSVVMGVVEFLIRIVEFLANTMSYARLGILLLVHAALLMVLNRAVSLPLAAAVPMLIVFNIMIMLLEGLIVYIQDLRLHLYEWFTKFYEGTGLPFRRMKPETTYFDIEWERNAKSASTSERQV